MGDEDNDTMWMNTFFYIHEFTFKTRSRFKIHVHAMNIAKLKLARGCDNFNGAMVYIEIFLFKNIDKSILLHFKKI